MKIRLEEDQNRMKIREAKEKSYIQINQAKSMVAHANKEMNKEQRSQRRQHSIKIQHFKNEVELELKRNAQRSINHRLHARDSKVLNKITSYQSNREMYSDRIKEQIEKANEIDTMTRELEQMEI